MFDKQQRITFYLRFSTNTLFARVKMEMGSIVLLIKILVVECDEIGGSFMHFE